MESVYKVVQIMNNVGKIDKIPADTMVKIFNILLK